MSGIAPPLFSEDFFKDPGLFPNLRYVCKDGDVCQVTTKSSGRSSYWQKITAPQVDLSKLSEKLSMLITQVEQYINPSENASEPPVYAAEFRAILFRIKAEDKKALEEKFDFFKQHITIINNKFLSASKKNQGCLHGVILTIINLFRRMVGKRPISSNIQLLQNDKIEQFINHLKKFAFEKKISVSLNKTKETTSAINRKLEILSLSPSNCCNIQIDEGIQLLIQNEESQYTFKLTSDSGHILHYLETAEKNRHLDSQDSSLSKSQIKTQLKNKNLQLSNQQTTAVPSQVDTFFIETSNRDIILAFKIETP